MWSPGVFAVFYGRPFVSRLWHDIRAVFFPLILAIIPATRYTCVFSPRILAFFLALWGFYSQVYDHFLTNAHIYAHKKGDKLGHRKSSYKRHRIIPTAQNPFMYDGAEKLLLFESSMAPLAALISSKVWLLFIALTVVVVVGSPTTDLLEFVDCLLRDCVRNFTNADRNNDRFS